MFTEIATARRISKENKGNSKMIMFFHGLTSTQFKVFKQAVLSLFPVPILKSNYVSIFSNNYWKGYDRDRFVGSWLLFNFDLTCDRIFSTLGMRKLLAASLMWL